MMDPKNYIHFLNVIEKLKCNTRRSWTSSGSTGGSTPAMPGKDCPGDCGKMKHTIAAILCCVLLLTACQAPAVQVISTEPPPTQMSPPETSLETLPTETEAPTTVPTEPVFNSYALALSLNPEEKVGQLFLGRCPDTGGLEDIENYHLGGFILFGRDFENTAAEAVTAEITQYQSASAIPMLIAVDEEGGTVTRVSSQYRDSRFPSPRQLYEQGGLALIENTEAEKCILLQQLGINVNMAPVCDITTDPAAFMYERSLGQSPEETGNFVCTVLNVMDTYGIGGVLKHFPGYGNNADTHTGIAVDTRTLDALESCDLIPFGAGIKAGCGAILVSHTFVNCLDDTFPATLSPAVHNYLRQEMGFTGVIVTDDLQMQAITDLYGPGEAAVLAVLAGNDLLCSTDYPTQYAAVLEAVQSGRIPEDILNQAVSRVLQWKYDIGLLAE